MELFSSDATKFKENQSPENSKSQILFHKNATYL